MKKLNLKILAAILLSAFFAQTALAEFTDVFRLHKNYDAILYLQENGIIDGYPDGTFRPENKVNRAEFLKIIIEGSNIETGTTGPAPFMDVLQTQWYAPYVNKAYDEGWIVGYSNGNFMPEQTINKVEALKILGKVQNWQTSDSLTVMPYTDTPASAWYAPYVAYAYSHGYLEEQENEFSPEKFMTRANISEIIYRTLTLDPSATNEITQPQIDTPDTADTAADDTPDTSFTPVSQNTIPINFYEKITLDDEIPNTFYENEVYIIEGTAASGYDKTNILLDPDDSDPYNFEDFTGKIKNGRFEIPVYFTTPGNYNIGILPGSSGQTKVASISVIQDLPDEEKTEILTEKASSLSMGFANDTTSINFSAPQETVKKFTFLKNNKTVTYLSRQQKTAVPINYKNFATFGEGAVSYYVETAKLSSSTPLTIASNFTKSDTKTFIAAGHTFDQIEENEISASPPDKLEKGQKISFSGTVLVDTRLAAYITKPDGFVDEISLSTSDATGTYFETPIIKAGGTFSFSYSPSQEGRYIVEIINKDGLPELNHPVQIGSHIPLIPDYFDLNKREFFSGDLNLASERTALLNLINNERTQSGLGQVVTSQELNALAQAHANDMAENNYFGHINLLGETPDERRLKVGIETPVSENIAQDVSIEFAHYGLMRSGIHRKNTLEQQWTKVGIGLATNNGYVYVVEEFSTSPLTAEQLTDMENELFTEINLKRTQNGQGSLVYNSNLEIISKELNDMVINDSVALTDDVFQESLQAHNVTGISQGIGRIFHIWSDIISSILDDETSLIYDAWERIGIDLRTDDTGNTHATIVINKS
ncbi:MAG: S-layer homology domain-containing protein [Candidatus Peregrinibacteria bacterium]